MDIIPYLIQLCHQLYQQNCWLVKFICKYIPLRQWAFDDSHSPKYQKFKVDKLPKIVCHRQDWDFNDLNAYYTWKYGKPVKPVKRHSECDIPDSCTCPACKAPRSYLYRNNGKGGQLMCKVCGTLFAPGGNRFSRKLSLKCPYCGHALSPKKDRHHFVVHKCVNPKCPYYLRNLKKVDRKDLAEDYGKNKYKLHYIYREFTTDFFKMDITSLPRNASSLRFTKNNSHIMSLCLTYRVNLGLSLRKTAQAMMDIHGIRVSHQMVANYCKTAALCVKPFVDTYPYEKDAQHLAFAADETYIKVRGVKGFVWLVINAATRAIIGYRVSSERTVGPCIMAMRMAFQHIKEIPKGFRFIADGYSAYPLAAQQFFRRFGEKFRFDITPVIGLQNDDAVSKEFRPYKQIIERLNRTYKASYRPTNGFDNYDGANYDLSLWVAYYNFLRPHQHNHFRTLVHDIRLDAGENMPAKWQILIKLGQQAILNIQSGKAADCS